MYLGFAGGLAGKEYPCNVGDLDSIPGFGRSPGGGHGNPLQYSCLENPHGQRSLEGCSPWGCEELDTTEQLSTAHIYFHIDVLKGMDWSVCYNYYFFLIKNYHIGILCILLEN